MACIQEISKTPPELALAPSAGMMSVADEQSAVKMRWGIEEIILASPVVPETLEQILVASRYRGRYL